jgi:hypothetical protein
VHNISLSSRLLLFVAILEGSSAASSGQAQESPAGITTASEIDSVNEAMQLINASSDAGLSWAKTQLRKTSGVWKPPGSAERTLHDFAAQILRDRKEMGNFIVQLELERAAAKTVSEPPLSQVLAGLYGYQRKGAIQRMLYIEVWQKKPDDPWLNLKVAEEFHLTKQPDKLIQALSLVWEKAPEMILYEAGRVGEWYAAAGRVDGVLDALKRLETRNPPLQGGSQWQKFLTGLQSGTLTAEQLDPIQRAVMRLAPPAVRQQSVRRRATVLMSEQKYAEAYDLFSQELFFNPEFAPKEQSDAAAGARAAYIATSAVSSFADAAMHSQRLDSLDQAARSLLELSPAWKQVGEILLAAVARRRGNEAPLLELAQRIRKDMGLLPPDLPYDTFLHIAHQDGEKVLGGQLAFLMQQELLGCKQRPALQFCLEWKQADEPKWIATGRALGMLRHERALIHVRLGELPAARQLWLSVRDAPKTDQELQALNISADQLRQRGFVEDALPLYRQLLHDWLPAYPDSPLKQRLQGVARHTVGEILGQLKEQWPTLTAERKQKLLAVLLEMLFADGRDAEPILPFQSAGQPGHSDPALPGVVAKQNVRPDVIPELAPTVLQFAAATKELARLREDWAKHPSQDSVAVLTLRAEAAAAAEDANDLSGLIAQLRRIEAESGQSPAFWSVCCLLHGLNDKLQQAFAFDFRNRKLDRKVFDLSGQSPWLVKPEAEGLRIRLPANTGAIGHVGVKTLFQVHGDFEAIATYEILKIDKPVAPKFYGGAMLIAEFANSDEHANLRRERHTNGDDFYTPHHHALSAQEQTQTLMQHVPTKAMKGQLALVRHGSTMHWLVKDDGQADFRLLQQDPCGTADIATIKLAIDSWGTQSLTDVRWLDLAIRAEQLLHLPAEHLRHPTELAASSVVLPPTPSRQWLWWLAGVSVAIPVLIIGVRRFRSSLGSQT